MEFKKEEVKKLFLSLLKTAFIVFIISTFFFKINIIYGISMQPEFTTGDRIILNIYQYNLLKTRQKRFDIVVIKCPYDAKKEIIKRIVGLGNEKIQLINGEIYINGAHITQNFPYIQDYGNYGPYIIPEGNIFVLGDNRLESEDSRYFGCVEKNLIIGKAQLKLWPLNKAGPIR